MSVDNNKLFDDKSNITNTSNNSNSKNIIDLIRINDDIAKNNFNIKFMRKIDKFVVSISYIL